MNSISAATFDPSNLPHAGIAAPAFDINVTPVETVLRRSPLVALGEYRCPVEHPQFAGGGPQRCPFVVFPRSSVRIIRQGSGPVTYTPNTVSLHNIGDVYRREPVSIDGERCDWIAVAPSLLREVACLNGLAARDDEHIFDVASAPSTAPIYAAQRALFRQLQAEPDMAPLAVEERAIGIVDAVCAIAARHGGATAARRSPRRFAGRAPAIVSATIELLARQYWQTLGIDDICAYVHCSPGYLSRLFRRSTGFTLHEYQVQLRLRAALEPLLETRCGLSELAIRLGFASHSHFTAKFSREFGVTPAQFRRDPAPVLERLATARAVARG